MNQCQNWMQGGPKAWTPALEICAMKMPVWKVCHCQFSSILFTKGQLISKCIFGVYNSPKKTNKNSSTWGNMVVKSTFFDRFLGELKITKWHFEINWPLKSIKSNLSMNRTKIINKIVMSFWLITFFLFKNLSLV